MLIHISGHTYVESSEIRMVEGFPATLLIKVTLKTGEVFERFVSEDRIDYWADKDGVHTAFINEARVKHGIQFSPIRVRGRDEAFKTELMMFTSRCNGFKPKGYQGITEL